MFFIIVNPLGCLSFPLQNYVCAELFSHSFIGIRGEFKFQFNMCMCMFEQHGGPVDSAVTSQQGGPVSCPVSAWVLSVDVLSRCDW